MCLYVCCCVVYVGTKIWYAYPQPGDVVQNNVAISVHTTVNEIRCYSPDTTSSNNNTMITSPPGSSPLTFTNTAAGRLEKTIGTAINDIDRGVYTCTYSNEGVTSAVNFAVYARDREPYDNGGSESMIYIQPTTVWFLLGKITHQLRINYCILLIE